MRPSAALALLLISTLMTGCDPDWGKDAGALNTTLPKREIIGCYRANGVPLIVRVEADRITAGGKPIYSSYDYGLGGRNAVPLLVVRPRMVLERDVEGTYGFKPWKQELGGSFSYPVVRQNGVIIRIISSDAVEHEFTKMTCA